MDLSRNLSPNTGELLVNSYIVAKNKYLSHMQPASCVTQPPSSTYLANSNKSDCGHICPTSYTHNTCHNWLKIDKPNTQPHISKLATSHTS